jgi:hypothetical protein
MSNLDPQNAAHPFSQKLLDIQSVSADGLTLDKTYTNAIKITGTTGLGLYINKTSNDSATIKSHCHLAASGVDVANEFKGEFLSTSGTMDGVASHFHMSASGTGVLRSVIGVAYLDSAITLSGTDAAGSWINGVLGSVSISGVLNGTAVTVTGTYGGLGSMVGSTLTACKYMSAMWADSQVTKVPVSGDSQLLLMTNGAGGTLNQAILLDASNRITEFIDFRNCGTMIGAKVDADVAYAHYRKLNVTVDGAPGWIYVEMAS